MDFIRQLLEERSAQNAIFDPYCPSDDILLEIASVSPQAVYERVVGISLDPYLACSQAQARSGPPRLRRIDPLRRYQMYREI